MKCFLGLRYSFFAVLGWAVLAQPLECQATPALKVGDRLKVNIGSGFKGTITKVVGPGDYVVKLDTGGENGTPMEFNTSGKNGILTALGASDVEVADVNDLEKISAGADTAPSSPAAETAPVAVAPADASATQAPAPAAGGTFKVGDRVEVRAGPDRWPAGTISKGLEHNLYYIRMDVPPGQSAPEIPAVPEEVRAITATAKDGLLPGESPENTALGDQTKFHVGERVEVGSGNLGGTGTVTRGLQSNQYLVLLDKYVGKGMPDYIALPDDIRPLTDGSKAPVIPDFPAVREPVEAPVQQDAKSGPPPKDLVRQLIQSFQETRADTYVINLDVHTMEIGKPRKMVAELDRDVVGDANTMIYPVHATLTYRTYEDNGKSVLIAERDNLYSFYIDSFGHWACVLPMSKTVKPTQSWTKP